MVRPYAVFWWQPHKWRGRISEIFFFFFFFSSNIQIAKFLQKQQHVMLCLHWIPLYESPGHPENWIFMKDILILVLGAYESLLKGIIMCRGIKYGLGLENLTVKSWTRLSRGPGQQIVNQGYRFIMFHKTRALFVASFQLEFIF